MDNNAVVQCVDIFLNNLYFCIKEIKWLKYLPIFYDILNARSTLQR